MNEISFALIVIMLLPIVIGEYVFAQERIEPITLNPDADRELVARNYVQIFSFQPTIKQANFEIDFNIDDKLTKEPFEAVSRIWPASGHHNLTAVADSGGFYEVNKLEGNAYASLRSGFFINLWPVEEYHIITYLMIDDNVSLKMNNPITPSKSKDFANNPDWDLRVDATYSSFEEMKKDIPEINDDVDEFQSIFKFDTVIYRSWDYKIKQSIYTIITFVPLILMFTHYRFVKDELLAIQAALFTGVAILLVTSLFAIRQFLPYEITLFETIILGFIALYAIWFSFNLKKNSKKKWK